MTDSGPLGDYPGLVLEALPDGLVAALEVRARWKRTVAQRAAPLEFLVTHLSAWTPGSVVRVAFLDGDRALHAEVANATTQVTDACNLTLDFGLDSDSGEYRHWTETDSDYSAEIRVSFDRGGYWSLVGTDSTDPAISDPANGIGGGPNQRSLNLGGFTHNRPPGWEGTVRHEFLHALAFQHEHQNMRGPCSEEFRWEDDEGYVPTQDARGVFVPDSAGRRPGIYTYLAGPPNHWSRGKVDHNLRTTDSPDVAAGPFDANSIMLYRFAPFFYKTTPSPCAPTGEGIELSDGDRQGLQLLYPATAQEISERATRAEAALTALGEGRASAFETEAVGVPESATATSSFVDRAEQLLHQIAAEPGAPG